MAVYRLAYNGDVAAGQLAVFQGASEAPISGFIRVERATRKNSQPAAARRVALKMGRLLRCSSVTYRSIRRAVACSWQAIRRKWANTRETGRVRKRVECPEQATARRMGQIRSFLPPRRRPILNATKPKGFRRRCTSLHRSQILKDLASSGK